MFCRHPRLHPVRRGQHRRGHGLPPERAVRDSSCPPSSMPVGTSTSSSATARWPSSALPNDLPDHADAAVTAAVLIHRLVAERFGGELRIGIGINTGVVIAGTIGGGGKLEFTTSSVTPSTSQPASSNSPKPPATRSFSPSSASTPWRLDRPDSSTGDSHVLKGKSAAVQVFGLDQETDARADLTR